MTNETKYGESAADEKEKTSISGHTKHVKNVKKQSKSIKKLVGIQLKTGP